MTDPTFEALLNHYQERGKRILELERQVRIYRDCVPDELENLRLENGELKQLCREMYGKLRLSAELPATFSDLQITETRMKSLGLLEEE